jgi:penicillin amidase
MCYSFLLQTLPQREGTVYLKGLDAPVKISRDEHAIPHISATTDHDAFFALGYLHAQERLWQMNLKRRMAQGRLSEVLGIQTLETDKGLRAYGLVRAAQKTLQSLDEPSLQVLETYAAGVNAWIKEGHILPVQFYIVDTEPELWKPEDSILLLKFMSLTLGPSHTLETSFDLLVKEIGLDRANEIIPNVNVNNSAAVDTYSGNLANSELQKSLITLNNKLKDEFKSGGEIAVGSNAWAVSGEYTSNGLPILAGDPHLLTEIPSVWYLADIKGERLHVTGATFPGAPLVFMGRNESVAWGITNMFPDSLDLYVERTNPLNPNQYEVDGEWVDMEVEEQLIHIKSAFPTFLTNPIPPIKWKARRTRNGPLISDAIGRVDSPLAIRWAPLDDIDKSFQSYLSMNYAQDLASFRSALEEYKAPAVNIIYADKENNIALFAAGKIPIRKKGNGRLPVPGWNSDYQWEKYIPFNEMPHRINPEEGYVVNANNKNHPEDYPYIISNIVSPPYRLNRIKEVIQGYIESSEKIEVQDFIALQGDTESLQTRAVLPFLQSLSAETPDQKEAIEKLRKWDGILSEKSEETAIYEIWLKHFNILLIDDDLEGTILNEARVNELQSLTRRLNSFLVTDMAQKIPSAKYDWCDQINTEIHETCEDLGLMALDATIEELDRILGFSKEWGDIADKYFPHPGFTNSPLLASIFDRSISANSDRYSINRADWSYSEADGYRVTSTAGYRQVIGLSDRDLSGFINSTGQSEHVISKHYDDNIALFKQLKLLPMHLGLKQGSEEERILNLEPIK